KGHSPSSGRVRNAFTRSSISSTKRQTWLFETPDAPHRLDQVIDRADRDAVHIGLLDHRRQCLFRSTSRLQEGRKVAALAQPGDLKLDPPGTSVPDPLTV